MTSQGSQDIQSSLCLEGVQVTKLRLYQTIGSGEWFVKDAVVCHWFDVFYGNLCSCRPYLRIRFSSDLSRVC